jgi:hypothetical protein
MKLRGLLLKFAVVPISLGLSSCLLLFQGTTEEIQVTSEPPGATVTLNNGETRVTPFTMTVPRNRDLQLHFSKTGYQSIDLIDGSQVEPAIFVDLFPLMLPWAIDAGAGAGFAHQQTSLSAHLDPDPNTIGKLQSDSPPRSGAAASDAPTPQH